MAPARTGTVNTPSSWAYLPVAHGVGPSIRTWYSPGATFTKNPVPAEEVSTAVRLRSSPSV